MGKQDTVEAPTHLYPLRDREFRQRKDPSKVQMSFREQSFPLLDAKMNKKVKPKIRSPKDIDRQQLPQWQRKRNRLPEKDAPAPQLPAWQPRGVSKRNMKGNPLW